MFTYKSFNYLHSQNTPPITVDEVLHEGNFFIIDISNGVINNNKEINTINKDTSTVWSKISLL